MLESAIYINHLNEALYFDYDHGMQIKDAKVLRGYEWDYNSLYKRVTSFEKNITEVSIPIAIFGDNVADKTKQIYETIEKDVLSEQRGKLYVGDYWVEGYFYANTKDAYLRDDYASITLSFVTDSPMWTKEELHRYRYEATGSELGFDYPYDFSYDYGSVAYAASIVNRFFTDQNVRIIFYGEISNPHVTIGDHRYALSGVSLAQNETLTIDTKKKTIVKIDSSGDSINCFQYRDKESYIFEKIPTGESEVSLPSSTNVDVIILAERSEPEWI